MHVEKMTGRAGRRAFWNSIRRRGLSARVISGLGCALFASLICISAAVQGLDDRLFDACFVWRGARPSTLKAFIVGLDGPTYGELNKPAVYLSPEFAEVVSYLKSQGAAAIGVDLIIPEDMSGLEGLQPGQIGDAATMGDAVAAAGNAVLARSLSGTQSRPLETLPQWRLKHLLNPNRPDSHLDQGFVDTTPDGDQFVRRQVVAIGENELHFVVALLARAKPNSPQTRGGRLAIDGEAPPLDASERMRINFVGPPGTFPVISLRDVLAAARNERALNREVIDFRDAIVVIGDVARGQKDLHAVPYANRLIFRTDAQDSGLMSGPELHLNILATLTDRAWIRTPWLLSMVPLSIVVGIGLALAFTRLGSLSGFALAIVFFFAWQALCVLVFRWTDIRLPIVSILLVDAFTYSATFIVRWNRLRRMLGVVKSVAIAQAMESGVADLDLQGDERVITVLFADVRNFTGFSESHSPHQVVNLLNTYFTAIVPLIEAEGGVLNQYVGDGIMVLFGAPARQADHATRAVRTATAMVRAVHSMSDVWSRLDCPTFRIGVGIHTGRAVVGTVGSPMRLDYTAIGDTTNTAARIEAETKHRGCEILISHETYQEMSHELRRHAAPEPIQASVKGKGATVRLHVVQAEPINADA